EILFSDYGSGAFNFFTSSGLKTVGGFHDSFAAYKRFGHTEHSRRFYLNHLSPSPFILPIELSDCCVWHNPRSSKPDLAANEFGISVVESMIMDQNLRYYPVNVHERPLHNSYPGMLDIPWLPLKDPYLSP